MRHCLPIIFIMKNSSYSPASMHNNFNTCLFENNGMYISVSPLKSAVFFAIGKVIRPLKLDRMVYLSSCWTFKANFVFYGQLTPLHWTICLPTKPILGHKLFRLLNKIGTLFHFYTSWLSLIYFVWEIKLNRNINFPWPY